MASNSAPSSAPAMPIEAVTRRPGAISDQHAPRIAVSARSQQRTAGASVGSRHQQHELLAAGAGDDVASGGRRRAAAPATRTRTWSPASCPCVVVDVLEVIEVEDREAERLGGVLQPAGEVAPVVQPGEPVAVGLLAELLLQRLELRRALLERRPRRVELGDQRRQPRVLVARRARLDRRALQRRPAARRAGAGLRARARRSGAARRRRPRSGPASRSASAIVASTSERACGTCSPSRTSAPSDGVLRLVEPPQRGQRLDLGAHGDAEHVRVRRALGGQATRSRRGRRRAPPRRARPAAGCRTRVDCRTPSANALGSSSRTISSPSASCSSASSTPALLRGASTRGRCARSPPASGRRR